MNSTLQTELKYAQCRVASNLNSVRRTLFKFDFPGNRYTLLQNQKNWPSQFPNDADRMPPIYSSVPNETHDQTVKKATWLSKCLK